MSQGAAVIANGSGGAVRAAINAAIARLQSGASGTGRPADIGVYEIWIETDNPGSGVASIWRWDGSQDVLMGLFNTTSHTITYTAETIAADVVIADAYKTTTGSTPGHSGTAVNLAESDNGRVVRFTSATAVAVTVPSTLAAGFSCTIVQEGAGQVTIVAGGGVTLRQRNGLKLAGQYAAAALIYLASDTYLVAGDVTP